jgi:hypothetical protein
MGHLDLENPGHAILRTSIKFGGDGSTNPDEIFIERNLGFIHQYCDPNLEFATKVRAYKGATRE